MLQTTSWNPLWSGHSSISIRTHCQCATRTMKSHGWLRSSSKMPFWIPMSVKWMSRSMIHNNASGHPPFIISIPISKWCFFLETPPLWYNQWIKELWQLLRPSTWRGPLPELFLQLWKTLVQFWKASNIYDYIRTLLGLGVMSPRSMWMVSRRKPSKGSFMTSKDLPRMRRLRKSTRLWWK